MQKIITLEEQFLDGLISGLTDAAQQLQVTDAPPRDIVDWAGRNFYVAESWLHGRWVTWKKPIVLRDYQKELLTIIQRLILGNQIDTIVWSEVKKSGKTTIGALMAQWWAEEMEPYNEIIICANDLEQASSRVFAALRTSLLLNPQAEETWEIPKRAPYLTYLPKHTEIKAIPTDYQGAAGANPGLTVWSELWAYTSENAYRLYEELTPVPTRAHSIRFIETYAGYLGESKLLWEIYHKGVRPEKRLSGIT